MIFISGVSNLQPSHRCRNRGAGGTLAPQFPPILGRFLVFFSAFQCFSALSCAPPNSASLTLKNVPPFMSSPRHFLWPARLLAQLLYISDMQKRSKLESRSSNIFMTYPGGSQTMSITRPYCTLRVRPAKEENISDMP